MFGDTALEGVVTPAFVEDKTGTLEHINLITFGPYFPLAGPSNPITETTIVRVFEQINSLMDWTPSLVNVNVTSIKFNQEQREQICVHGACFQ